MISDPHFRKGTLKLRVAKLTRHFSQLVSHRSLLVPIASIPIEEPFRLSVLAGKIQKMSRTEQNGSYFPFAGNWLLSLFLSSVKATTHPASHPQPSDTSQLQQVLQSPLLMTSLCTVSTGHAGWHCGDSAQPVLGRLPGLDQAGSTQVLGLVYLVLNALDRR
jgi:hypothetical protein